MPVTITGFQKSGFQNNGFQIALGIADTHDGLPKKFYLPIYEYTKKKRRIEKRIEVEQSSIAEIIEELPSIPLKSKEWNNREVEAFAEKTMQSITNVERQIEAIKKYENELDEEEDDLLMLALVIH